MRNKIVAGNWKMNNDADETEALLNKLKKYNFTNDVIVMVSPSFTNLQKSVINLSDSKIEVIAQNINGSEKGAYTGEVSPSMLKSIGVSRVIIGHSERRQLFGEDVELLSKKILSAHRHGLIVIFCIGELESEIKNRKSI